MSAETHWSIALAMILRYTSPTARGWTSGFLSKATKRAATNATKPAPPTRSVHSFRAAAAMAAARLDDAPLKEDSIRCHACTSRPDGPPDPFILPAAFLTTSAVMASKIMDSGSDGSPRRRTHEGGLVLADKKQVVLALFTVAVLADKKQVVLVLGYMQNWTSRVENVCKSFSTFKSGSCLGWGTSLVLVEEKIHATLYAAKKLVG
eukprot:scpid80706/ scgid21322/ 